MSLLNLFSIFEIELILYGIKDGNIFTCKEKISSSTWVKAVSTIIMYCAEQHLVTNSFIFLNSKKYWIDDPKKIIS